MGVSGFAKATVAGITLLCIGGCSGVPPLFLAPPLGETGPGRVNRIVARIDCELAKARDTDVRFKHYVAAAQLTLKIEDGGGITPSISFIHPLAVSGETSTKAIGGEFSRGRLRTFTQTVIIDIDKADSSCKLDDGSELTGDLGLKEVITAGLDTLSYAPTGTGHVADWKKEAQSPYFGSTIQFSNKVGLNGGPSLSQAKFKGFGGNNGLVNLSRTGTDLLTIAFAPIEDPGKPAPASGSKLFEMLLLPPQTDAERADEARRTAGERAQQLLNSMILQNIDLTR